MHYLLTPINSLWGISPLSLELLSKTQQPDQFAGIPFWVWILAFLLVIIFAVIWTLREEGEAGKKQEEAQVTSATEPALATAPPAEPAPVAEAEPTPAVETPAESAPVAEAEPTPAVETPAEPPAPATEAEPTPAVEAPAEPAPVTEAEPIPAVEAPAEPVPTTEAEPIPAAETPTEPTPPPRPDNLKLISGIGPKIETLLKDNGITTFAQLAETEVSRLDAMLDEADLYMADPSTWPEQARKLAQ